MSKLRFTFISYGHVSRLDAAADLVLSADGQSIYTIYVQVERDGNVEYTCTCPAFQFRKNACKHIAAVMIDRKATQTKLPQTAIREKVFVIMSLK